MMAFSEEFVANGDRLDRVIRMGGSRYISSMLDPGVGYGTNPRDRWDKALLLGHVPNLLSPGRGRLGIADLFCGAGGLSQGILQACRTVGVQPDFCLAIDEDPAVLETYCRNFSPKVVDTKGIMSCVDYHVTGTGERAEFTYTPEILDIDISRLQGQVDLLVAGPPCQGHSNLNNHTRHNDPRNGLYLTVPAFAVAMDVPMVLIENVPGITRDESGVLSTAQHLLEKAGYKVRLQKLKATEFGVPQTRTRLILLASKYGVAGLDSVLAAYSRPERAVSWAIDDLVDRHGPTLFDTPPAIDETNQRRANWLHENDQYDLPNEERPDCHKDGHTYKSVYGRMYWDRPAMTITRGFSVAGRGRYIHSKRPRTLTPHEGARIQGFPDSFRFETQVGQVPSRSDLVKMIGNAVPPVFGEICTMAMLLDATLAKTDNDAIALSSPGM